VNRPVGGAGEPERSFVEHQYPGLFGGTRTGCTGGETGTGAVGATAATLDLMLQYASTARTTVTPATAAVASQGESELPPTAMRLE
jgi:hypothetical protein